MGDSLLFTDIPSSRILRYTPSSARLETAITRTGHANGLAVDDSGRLYACQSGAPNKAGGRQVVRYGPAGQTTVVCDRFEGRRLNSPCDLVVDARDRVWFSDPRYGDRAGMELDHESVYRVDPDGPDAWRPAERVTSDTTAPNGLLVSPDGATLYVAELKQGIGARRELRAYPISDDGSVGSPTVLYDFAPHRGVDGMCLDRDGNILAAAGWECSGPGAMIYVFSPRGDVLERHPVPTDRPTNCAFGGAALSDLYVTTMNGELLLAPTERVGPARVAMSG
jgi:gluconolactonase